MLFLFKLFECIGYFLILILFMVGAILLAKKKIGWVLYAVGAVLQLLSQIGNQKRANLLGVDDMNMPLMWVIYVALLVITAIIVAKRYKKAHALTNTEEKP